MLSSLLQEPVSEEHVLTHELDGHKRSMLSPQELDELAEGVDARGMHLQQLLHLCQSFKALAPVSALHADDFEGQTRSSRLRNFRDSMVHALANPTQRVLLNYHMSTLGQVSV